MALILPAKSHSQVIIHAIVARDKTRATGFANKHGIPVVKNRYEGALPCLYASSYCSGLNGKLEILDDPAIDVVYIPLPTGLHLEWAVKALIKGKYVLPEKPAGSSSWRFWIRPTSFMPSRKPWCRPTSPVTTTFAPTTVWAAVPSWISAHIPSRQFGMLLAQSLRNV
jgi:hypothetical protein